MQVLHCCVIVRTGLYALSIFEIAVYSTVVYITKKETKDHQEQCGLPLLRESAEFTVRSSIL